MAELKLFMTMLGCKPAGRHTEQHDIFFGIGQQLKDLVPQITAFWPEAKGKIHIDAYREINFVNNFKIEVVETGVAINQDLGLFFLNLGGYKPDVFDELHYKILVVAPTLADAIVQAKQTAFYKHTGFKNAESHIDDKYGVDVDDAYNVADILSTETKSKYQLKISQTTEAYVSDPIYLGYYQLHKL